MAKRRKSRRGRKGKRCPVPKGAVIKHIKLPHSRKKVARAVKILANGKWKFVKWCGSR